MKQVMRSIAYWSAGPRARDAIVVLAPFGLYVVHSLLLGNWIIDDAGISFAYSRNLAHGYGLVSQPGLAPVEGFSNFSWVVLLAFFSKSGLFNPLTTPKLVAGSLVLLSYVIVGRIAVAVSGRPRKVTLLALTLLSMNTSFVVWTMSGLENSLYAFLTLLLLERTATYARRGNTAVVVGISLLAFLIAVTRPDGLLYALVFPVLALLSAVPGHKPAKRAGADCLVYFSILAVLLAVFVVFRVHYFKDILPHTYHVKGGPDLGTLVLMRPTIYEKSYGLLWSVGWGLAGPLTVCLIFTTMWLVNNRSLTGSHAAGCRGPCVHSPSPRLVARVPFCHALLCTILPLVTAAGGTNQSETLARYAPQGSPVAVCTAYWSTPCLECGLLRSPHSPFHRA
ncbi:MAG: hypothetical protein NTX53_21950 [candidate division WOR-3 bacterium]|nr:hypothetical protein [candidate division WOR-3 bacterium]